MVGRITFTAVRPEDIAERSSGHVAFSHVKSNHAALDFTANYKASAIMDVERSKLHMLGDNIRNHVTLPFPVVNKVLAGSELEVIRSITQLKEIAKLMTFDKVLDTHDISLIERNAELDNTFIDIENPRYLVGAEALKYLIEQLDTSEVISTYIAENIIRPAIKDLGITLKAKDPVPGDITQGPMDNQSVKVARQWYYTAPEGSELMHVLTKEKIHDQLTGEYNKQRSPLSYMVNMFPSKDRLLSMFMRDIIVPPSGLHPTIDNRVDAFMDKTAKLLDAINTINSIIRRSSEMRLRDYISHISNIQSRIDRLIFKSDSRDVNDSSFGEKMKGKFGYIRAKMLGKRGDFSARAIITINPELSIDECALPTHIIAEIYKYHHIKACIGIKSIRDINNMSADDAAREIESLGILDRVPCHLNRAPSLHKLSYMGFRVKLGKTKAIEISTLVTTGFNADFDGDSMGVHAPLSQDAIDETLQLMLPSRNIRHPASGKPILVPKMEMVYGLNQATRRYEGKGVVHTGYQNNEDLLSAVRTHKIKVYDFVMREGHQITAGRAAFNALIPTEKALGGYAPTKEEDSVNIITSKNIANIMNHVLENYDTEYYRQVVDDLVGFGFKMAKLYSPTINVLDEFEDELLNDPLKEFNEEIREAFELHQVGLEEEEAYLNLYVTKLDEVTKRIEDSIEDVLGPDNGFLQLVLAGARGSKSNLVQTHWMKGIIQKSDYESFAAVIDRGFVDQLHPLQHFISAYGSRKGLTDRARKTGDTGYLGRLLFHAASDYVITNEDCKTTEGLEISKGALLKFVKDDDHAKRDARISEIFAKCIMNRVQAENGLVISESTAEKLSLDPKVESIKIRSPLGCENPCCQVCHGFESGTAHYPAIGTPIGFIAGQAVGEPGTQLTMRTFQKGGVAGKKDVTSNFDRINKFINLGNFSQMNTYDPIAWATGSVVVVSQTATTKSIKIDGSKKTPVSIAVDAEIKPYVEKGEGMSSIPGDSNIKDLLLYSSFENTQRYLLNALYTCYLGQAEINLIHFEILVASMTVHGVYDTNSPDIKIGQLYTAQRIHEEKRAGYNIEYYKTLKSVKALPVLKDSPLSNIVLEDVVRGFTKATLLGLEDRLDTNMGRLLLGLKPNLGTGLTKEFLNRP